MGTGLNMIVSPKVCTVLGALDRFWATQERLGLSAVPRENRKWVQDPVAKKHNGQCRAANSGIVIGEKYNGR